MSGEKQQREAEQYLRHALSIDPGIADAHDALGTIAKDRNDQVGSVDYCTRALELKPDFDFAYGDLVAVLTQSGQIQKVMDVLRRAISVCPESAEFQFYLGNLFAHDEDYDNAACYKHAVALKPKSAAAHQYLGNALVARGATQEVVACYEQVMRLDPENAVQHRISALSGRDSERAPSDYVEKLFDKYAHNFDEHLVGALSYPRTSAPADDDAAASDDVLSAADVFVYLGTLNELVHQVQRRLHPGGLFAFPVKSLEALTDDAASLSKRRDYQLNITPRYAHSIAYLARMAAHNGFDVLSTTDTQCRLDKGKPMQGYLALWCRPPA